MTPLVLSANSCIGAYNRWGEAMGVTDENEVILSHSGISIQPLIVLA